jgi:poly(hydroxyalkanoate) depolymerase family esterase
VNEPTFRTERQDLWRTLEIVSEQRTLSNMNDRLNFDKMVEATRLTRAGRLSEATALIQRMLRGEAKPASGDPAETARAAAEREPPHVRPHGSPVVEPNPSPPARFGVNGRPADMVSASAVTAARPQLLSALGTLVDRVKRLRSRPEPQDVMEPAPAPRPDVAPEAGTFIEATYSNSAGSRAYKLYVAGGYHGQAVPLIIMLHSCTQSPDDFAAGTRMNMIADKATCLVAYPGQPSSANPNKCWNWFRPGDQRRDHGEPSLIAGITREIMRGYAVDPQRVYLAGLSAGGAAAAIMGEAYPDLYAAIGVHSGLACGIAHDLPSAFAAMRQGELRAPSSSASSSASPGHRPAIPTIVFHGDRDTMVHPRNCDHVIAQSTRAAHLQKKVHRGRVAGGHAYTRTVHSDARGRAILERWDIHGAGHAWSGGSPAGSYTDPHGPDASTEMLRFFLEHRLHEHGTH